LHPVPRRKRSSEAALAVAAGAVVAEWVAAQAAAKRRPARPPPSATRPSVRPVPGAATGSELLGLTFPRLRCACGVQRQTQPTGAHRRCRAQPQAVSLSGGAAATGVCQLTNRLRQRLVPQRRAVSGRNACHEIADLQARRGDRTQDVTTQDPPRSLQPRERGALCLHLSTTSSLSVVERGLQLHTMKPLTWR